MSEDKITDTETLAGPALVAVANGARAFDAPVRSPLSREATSVAGGFDFENPLGSAINMARGSSFISLIEHFIGFIILLPILFFKRGFSDLKEAINKFDLLDWISAIYISVGASALGLFFFLIALGYGITGTESNNVTVAILIQKSQPLITLAFAAVILRERPIKEFYVALVGAILGIFLLSWPSIEATLQYGDYFMLVPVIASLLAATLWGGGTVFGRILTDKVDYWDLTLIRYTGGFLFLVLFNLVLMTFNPKFFDLLVRDVMVFGTPANPSYGTPQSIIFLDIVWGGLICIIYSAIFTGGILPLALYYFGLKVSKASIAGLAELMFPVLSIVVNYLFLNESLALIQLFGAAILLVDVTALTYINQKAMKKEKIME